jgi:hypothetical protein
VLVCFDLGGQDGAFQALVSQSERRGPPTGVSRLPSAERPVID